MLKILIAEDEEPIANLIKMICAGPATPASGRLTVRKRRI